MACKDIALMARRMLALDLVISVDTMTAHLAGALGLPVWTLLPVPSDWRWMSAGRMTPWYPTMELFRQPSAGDWRAVILEVRERLEYEGGTRHSRARYSFKRL
jgi:ADP-heptose:LPS heptosyltransferase